MADREIQQLRAKIHKLRQKRAVLSAKAASSTSSNAIHTTLPTTKNPLQDNSPFTTTALEKASTQQRLQQENLYRLGAGATLFSVRDPDPAAADDGHITGVRLEVFIRRRFLQPYYLLLNRHHLDESRWRIHRHTIPACIPLASLAAKYLPLPQKGPSEQNLAGLVRALRRELVAYHMRLSKLQMVKRAIAKADLGLTNIQVSTEAREIRFHTEDGFLTRIVCDKEGRIDKCVAVSSKGRDHELERAVVEHGSVDGLGAVLRELL